MLFNTRLPLPEWAGIPLSHIHDNENLPRLPSCPDCKGRGYFCNTWDVAKASIVNMHQCKTCRDSKRYYDEHGVLPPDLVKRIEANT